MADTVLVVEDEVLIRFDISDQLRAEGYEVLEASTAQQAIEMLNKTPLIALVFTDVQMPGKLNGLDLADHIVRHHPSIKIIVTSGHIAPSELPAGLGKLVEKPYNPRQVIELVRSVLG